MRNVLNYQTVDEAAAKESAPSQGGNVTGSGYKNGIQIENDNPSYALLYDSNEGGYNYNVPISGSGYYCFYYNGGSEESNYYGKYRKVRDFVGDVYNDARRSYDTGLTITELEREGDGKKAYVSNYYQYEAQQMYILRTDGDVSLIPPHSGDIVYTDGYWYYMYQTTVPTGEWKVTSIVPGVAYCRENEVVMYNGDGGSGVVLPTFNFESQDYETLDWEDVGMTHEIYAVYEQLFSELRPASDYKMTMNGHPLICRKITEQFGLDFSNLNELGYPSNENRVRINPTSEKIYLGTGDA